MTKVRKVKRRKKFRVNVNRKRLRNKLQKLPNITCEEIKNEWKQKVSTRSNLSEMGLAYDPNEVLQIPNTKRDFLEGSRKLSDHENNSVEELEECLPLKVHVAQNLEADAKAPRERMFRLPKSEVHFVTYLMDKYKDDYKAMVRDEKNYYQMTWRQIRAKINKFKSIPEQYAEYLLKTGEIVLESPESLEETKKKIAEENKEKYCAKKKKSIVQESLWKEESINRDDEKEGTEMDCTDTEDLVHEVGQPMEGSKKKMQLFSDDESNESDGMELNEIGNSSSRKSKSKKRKKKK
ncbi:nucleolar protein 16 [Orussus abietinus]|uniref:nucleolar protein 16 n=1 Tax=Orussus abietinus TaxID=222816 RepID=UPI00062544D8|nr:nucleolar protein 16 [Orussus abietinus]